MADFTALKSAIQTYIKQNGNEEITGEKLQEILLSVVTTLGDSAINNLVTALANEVAARQNADGTLQQNITNEATARGNADTALGGRLGSTITEENTAADQIGAEAEARATADTVLQGLIDGITDNIENGYVYAGIATPSSTPATGKVFYLALTAGTYTNFGSTVVSQGINILKYNGSAWSLDAFIGIDDELTPGSNNLPKSGNVLENIIKNGSAFDLSAYNAVDGVLATYADLDAALTALNALPSVYKQGGMSLRFVHTSDNKYVQYRLMSDTFNTTVANWQGVDDEPTAGSDNLVKSGGVYAATRPIEIKTEGIEQSEALSDTDEIIINDNNNNEIMHISSDGVSAKNLKSNGKNCVATEQIQENSTQDQTSEVEFLDNNNNVVATINNDGIFDKNGDEILGGGLSGKKAIFFGDSITEGIATADWQKQWFGGWPRLLRDRGGMTVSNKGIGGTTLRDNAQNSNGICQRLIADTTLNQYDYIILSGGFNDFANWSADDSVITDGYNSAFDTTKSMGALENCINYLQKNFPDKHIGFILCYDIGAIYEPYYEAIVEVLEKWSMPYIDLRKESAFNLNNHDQANVYGVYEGSVAWFDSTQNYVTDDKCQYNGVVYSAKHNITAGGSFNEADWNLAPEGTHTGAPWHINVIGYRKSYSQIKSWMETL